ncbi:MAG: CCA tRNA nucleotidyltransferase, partial [Boseongicola sp.]|nr:CCA tRNA nucleotidyltransferase [Boseongicola sp.]
MKRIDADWLITTATQSVFRMLAHRGYEAYAVGGCVRNTLLGVPVTDIDIATSASPTQVLDAAKSVGLKAIPTGFDHGTVTIVSEGTPFEVTTYRQDVKTDGRRAIVSFTDDIRQDARRRDFTMNALYVDASGNLLDPLDGLS